MDIGEQFEEGCPYPTQDLKDVPIGMFHCPCCGCMIIAGFTHPPCIDEECPYYDEAVAIEVEKSMGSMRGL